MPTLDEVKAQIDALPHKYIFYTKREINMLPEILIEGEVIRALVSGYIGKRTALAVCTNRRVLLLDKGFFLGMRQWQLGLDRIQSINGDYVIAFGNIRLWDGATAITLNMVFARNIDPFIKEVRQAIDDFKQISFREVTSQPRSDGTDVASQLERLAALRDSGHLTEEEFAHQKYKILNG